MGGIFDILLEDLKVRRNNLRLDKLKDIVGIELLEALSCIQAVVDILDRLKGFMDLLGSIAL